MVGCDEDQANVAVSFTAKAHSRQFGSEWWWEKRNSKLKLCAECTLVVLMAHAQPLLEKATGKSEKMKAADAINDLLKILGVHRKQTAAAQLEDARSETRRITLEPSSKDERAEADCSLTRLMLTMTTTFHAAAAAAAAKTTTTTTTMLTSMTTTLTSPVPQTGQQDPWRLPSDLVPRGALASVAKFLDKAPGATRRRRSHAACWAASPTRARPARADAARDFGAGLGSSDGADGMDGSRRSRATRAAP